MATHTHTRPNKTEKHTHIPTNYTWLHLNVYEVALTCGAGVSPRRGCRTGSPKRWRRCHARAPPCSAACETGTPPHAPPRWLTAHLSHSHSPHVRFWYNPTYLQVTRVTTGKGKKLTVTNLDRACTSVKVMTHLHV